MANSYNQFLEVSQDLLKKTEEDLAAKTATQKPLEDELIILQSQAALLEETEDNVQALIKALYVAVTKKDIAVTKAKIEVEARGAS